MGSEIGETEVGVEGLCERAEKVGRMGNSGINM